MLHSEGSTAQALLATAFVLHNQSKGNHNQTVDGVQRAMRWKVDFQSLLPPRVQYTIPKHHKAVVPALVK